MHNYRRKNKMGKGYVKDTLLLCVHFYFPKLLFFTPKKDKMPVSSKEFIFHLFSKGKNLVGNHITIGVYNW